MTETRAWHSIFVHDSSSDHFEASESDSWDFIDHYESLPPAPRLVKAGLFQSNLRRRELGLSHQSAQRKVTAQKRRDFCKHRSWTGASKDVLSVAWAADDSSFAIGSSADHLDSHGIPYNRNNNLIFGNVETNSLYELPDHYVSLANGTQASTPNPGQCLTDPRLFCAISQVSFGTHHPTLYTAGYDKTVRIWDVSSSRERPACRYTLPHDGYVDFAVQMPARSLADPQILVTGQQSTISPSIQLFGLPDLDAPQEELAAAYDPIATFASERARRFPLVPSAVEWGPDPYTRKFLFVGFREHSANALKEREGHLALWDVSQPRETLLELRNNTENVFDVAWQPGKAIIAAATTARNTKTLSHQFDTKSVIRTWSPTENESRVYELECPARDVNELQFHPTRDLITASCTDGRTYVWDFRMVDRILMTLNHGEPIETFDVSTARPREEVDVGVRFTAWAQNNRYFYTGGSDGRLLCWDILACVESEDASVQEVARFDAGIMAGAFSKDESKLLLGLVKGSVEILSIGSCSKAQAAKETGSTVSNTELAGTLDHIPAESHFLEEESETLGIEIARALLATEKLVQTKYGIGQGPQYIGPWSRLARPLGTTDCQMTPLLPDIAIQQFDKNIRRDGRSRGAIATAKTENRHLAKKLYAIAKERHRDDLVLRNRGQDLGLIEDEVKGPDEWELLSLSELSLLDSRGTSPLTYPTSSPITHPRPNIRTTTTSRTILSPRIKTESGWALGPKRVADASYELPARKRIGTPGENGTTAIESTNLIQPIQASAADPMQSSLHATGRTDGTRGHGSTVTNGTIYQGSGPIEVIEISSDDDDDPKAKVSSTAASVPHTVPPAQNRPARSSPTRRNTPNGGNCFENTSTPRQSPVMTQGSHTPSRRMPSAKSSETPNSQRTIVPSSQGRDGFQIPARIATTPTPEP